MFSGNESTLENFNHEDYAHKRRSNDGDDNRSHCTPPEFYRLMGESLAINIALLRSDPLSRNRFFTPAASCHLRG